MLTVELFSSYFITNEFFVCNRGVISLKQNEELYFVDKDNDKLVNGKI